MDTLPLQIGTIKEIISSSDIPKSIKGIANVYHRRTYQTPLDINAFCSCIDDRPLACKVTKIDTKSLHSDQFNQYFDLNENTYHIFRIKRSVLEQQTSIGIRSWPGGAFGLDLLLFYAFIISGNADELLYKKASFDSLLEQISVAGNDIKNKYLLPIHIDNHHGDKPLLDERGFLHVENIKTLIIEGKGCGFLTKILHILYSLLWLTGYDEYARQILTIIEGEELSQGMISVPQNTSVHIADKLYRAAKRQGCPIDIVRGQHAPKGVIFTFGKNTINRQLIEDAFDQTELKFKVDLYPLIIKESIAGKIFGDVAEAYNVNLNPLQIGIAINLLTLLYLEQTQITRYYIE